MLKSKAVIRVLKKNKTKGDLDDTGVTSRYPRLFRAPPDKQIFVKAFIAKFDKWGEWQRKIILCGITGRCSKELLNVLMTAFLPMLHKKRKTGKSRKSGRKKKGIHKTETLGRDSKTKDDNGTPLSKDEPSSSPLPASDDQGVEQPVKEEHRPTSQTERSGEEKEEISTNSASTQEKSNEEQQSTPSPQLMPTGESEGSTVCRTAGDISEQRQNTPTDTGTTSPTDRPTWTDHARKAVITDTTRQLDFCSDCSSSQASTPVSQRKLLSQNVKCWSPMPSSTKEQQTSNTRSPVSSVEVHTHKIAKIDSSVTSRQLLPPINDTKLAKLGPFMASKVEKNVNVHTVKNKQWWLPSMESSTLIKPSKSTLLEAFKSDANELWKIFPYWSNAEKGECILEICLQCSTEELKYFGECVNERMKEKCDINRLSAGVLQKIFDNLDLESLEAVSQVCERWNHLVDDEMLWKARCYSIAEEFDLVLYMNREIRSGMWIGKSWQDVYQELLSISRNPDLLKRIIDESKDAKLWHLPSKDWMSIQNVVIPQGSGNQAAGMTASNQQSTDTIPDYVKSSFHVKRTTASLKSSAQSRDRPTPETTVSEGGSEQEGRCSNMDDYLGGTLAIVENNLKKVASTSSDLDENDVVLDIRTEPVQARNELTPPKEYENKDDADEEFAEVTVPGVKPLKRVRKLRGHFEGVMALYSDSKRVMTGSGDRIVRVWDVRTGRKIRKLEGHKGGVRSLVFDSECIYTGSWDMSIIVWDIIKFNRIDTLFGHKGCVSCLETSENLLISGSHDASVLIWDKTTRNLIKAMLGHEGAINCLNLQDEENLFSGGIDGTLRHWNINLGICIRVFQGTGQGFNAVKICGDLVAGGCSAGKISFWNKRNGVCEAAIQAHKGPVNALCFVGARFITAGSDEVIKEWDLSTGACLRTLRGHKGAVYCLKATRKRIISGSADNTARVWELETFSQQVGATGDTENNNSVKSRVIESGSTKT